MSGEKAPRPLAFDEAGAGPALVMLHSGGMSSRQWRRAAERLAPSYRVLLPDLLGYGASGAWPEGERFELADEIAAVEAFLRGLGAPAHLVGHSYGAFIALQAALAAPELVRSLALYEPVAFGVLDRWADAAALESLARGPDAAPGEGAEATGAPPRPPAGAEATGAPPSPHEGFLRRFVDYWSGPGAWDALRPGTRDDFRRVAPKLRDEVRALLEDRTPPGAYAAVRAPTLLLSGELSPPDAREVAARLAGAIPGARHEVLPAAGHMGPLTHHDTFLALLEAHLRAASGPP
ncbi:MAG TPA: alpha/beta hydrolase [Polyangiaceae bacterium]|nr:alpha/beta hydrolase [Polyangiaceae bacterium]